MHTKQNLKNDINRMGILSNDTLLVHSSMKSVGTVDGGADTVLDALSESVKDGLLVMPTLTWSTVNASHPVFDVCESASCVGILPELFRKRPHVFRSLHPTHSIAALGFDAQSFVSGQEQFNTPCAPDSCYGQLEKRDAKVLMIGVNFAANTLVHWIEEIACVPDRLGCSQQQLYARDTNKNLISIPSFRHEHANSETYIKLEPVMIDRGFLKKVRFGDAECLLFRVKDLYQLTLELLDKDIKLFDNFDPVPKEWY